MKTYKTLFWVNNDMMKSFDQESDIQAIFDKAYEIAEKGNEVIVYDYADDKELVNSWMNGHGEVITHWDDEKIHIA